MYADFLRQLPYMHGFRHTSLLNLWKSIRYRHKLVREITRRYDGGILKTDFDRDYVDHMVQCAMRSNQSPALLARQLSECANKVRQEQSIILNRRIEQLSVRGKAQSLDMLTALETPETTGA